MKLGYARVSTEDQRLDLQRARLIEAGCGKLFEEKVSGAARQRPALEQLLRELRADDILVVTRLDRLARSTAELLRIAEVISEKNAGLQSLGEPWADTTTPAGRHGADDVRRCRRVRALADQAPHRRGPPSRQAPRRVVWTAAEATARSEDPCPLPGRGGLVHQRSRHDLQRPPPHHPPLPQHVQSRQSGLMTVHRTTQTHGPINRPSGRVVLI